MRCYTRYGRGLIPRWGWGTPSAALCSSAWGPPSFLYGARSPTHAVTGDLSPTSSSDVYKAWSFTSTPPIRPAIRRRLFCDRAAISSAASCKISVCTGMCWEANPFILPACHLRLGKPALGKHVPSDVHTEIALYFYFKNTTTSWNSNTSNYF